MIYNPLDTQELNEIVAGCIQADSKHRKAFYMLFAPHMLSVSHRYARNREDAEDIFQESVLKTFNNIHQLKDLEKIEWWTKRIVINEAIQFYNKNRKLIFTENYETFQQVDDFSMDIFKSMELEEVLEAIRTLPDKMRLVINLYAIEGYSHDEIADMLKISVGTSKSNLFDARKRIKGMLSDKRREII
jgi:RNA polymerase sigma-70 factor (ECF subfamily)